MWTRQSLLQRGGNVAAICQHHSAAIQKFVPAPCSLGLPCTATAWSSAVTDTGAMARKQCVASASLGLQSASLGLQSSEPSAAPAERCSATAPRAAQAKTTRCLALTLTAALPCARHRDVEGERTTRPGLEPEGRGGASASQSARQPQASSCRRAAVCGGGYRYSGWDAKGNGPVPGKGAHSNSRRAFQGLSRAWPGRRDIREPSSLQ